MPSPEHRYNPNEMRFDIRDLGAQVRELRAMLNGHIDLMKERKETVDRAFLAVERQTASALVAADTAAKKADLAQNRLITIVISLIAATLVAAGLFIKR